MEGDRGKRDRVTDCCLEVMEAEGADDWWFSADGGSISSLSLTPTPEEAP